MALIVFSGDMDKLYAAFIIATGSAAAGFEVTMFFTFWGLKALQKKGVSTGHSFFGRMIGIVNGGDISKANPSRYGFAGMGRWMFHKMMKSKNVSTLPELRQLAVELGVKMYPCQMTMDVMGLRKEELIDGVEVGGVGYYLGKAEDSNLNLFI